MKKYLILTTKLLLISFLFTSCNSGDDNSGSPSGSSGDPFIVPISQNWTDTAGNPKFFFGVPNSKGRFDGNELPPNGTDPLSGKTYRFDISFGVLKDPQTNYYVSYVGTITDTSSAHLRMVVYSDTDTLYLRP